MGPRTFQNLIQHFGSADAALAALPDLARRGGSASSPRIFTREQAAAELKAARARNVEYVALGEPAYPLRLQMIDDTPPLISVRENSDVFSRPQIAIVGSRNASAAGLKFAERMARALGAAGFAIVSDLARGMDAAAHRASLQTGTIAILAGGHDCVYPAEHVELVDGARGRRRCYFGDGLLKQGAIPVTEASDVIAVIELNLGRGIQSTEVWEPPQDAFQKNSEPGGDDYHRIVSLLGPTPVSINDLVRLA